MCLRRRPSRWWKWPPDGEAPSGLALFHTPRTRLAHELSRPVPRRCGTKPRRRSAGGGLSGQSRAVEADAHSGVSSATESALALPPHPYVFCQPHGVFGTHLRTVEPLGLRQRWVALSQKLSGPTQQMVVAFSTEYPPAEAGPRLQHGKSLVSHLTRHESPHDFPAGQHRLNSGSAHSSPGGQQADPHWVDPLRARQYAPAEERPRRDQRRHALLDTVPATGSGAARALGHAPTVGPENLTGWARCHAVAPAIHRPARADAQLQSCSTMPPLHGYTHSTAPLDVVQQLPPTQQLPF
jgi:hypothetical protein